MNHDNDEDGNVNRFLGSPGIPDEVQNGAAEQASSSSNSYNNLHRPIQIPIPPMQTHRAQSSPDDNQINTVAPVAIHQTIDPFRALRLQRFHDQAQQADNPNPNPPPPPRRHGGGGGGSGGGDDGGGGGGDDDTSGIEKDEEGRIIPPYNGFCSSQLCFQGDAVHPPRVPQGGPWTKLTPERIEGMTPIRAIAINIPAALIQRDALNFAQWSMPSGDGASRAFATAALTSGLFAGMAMGIPSGNHCEQVRPTSNAGATRGGGRKEGNDKPVEVDRYAYIPKTDEQDELPMFRIMYEEVKNKTDTDVTFIRVWILIFDPGHSTSELLGQVLSINRSLLASQSASGQDPSIRNRGFASEAERRKKAGFSSLNLHQNFETTVGMQFTRMHTMETYIDMLKLHAGNCVNHRGNMFVDDFEAHMNNAWGRRKLCGDTLHGHGSFHPAAPEFAFNGKRGSSLRYGARNLDGSQADIHPKYLNPDTYWDGDVFTLPENGDMWMCTSIDRRTIMELPLPRPLQNQVTPGDDLMYMFLETMDEQEAAAAEVAASVAHPREESAQDIADQMEVDQMEDDQASEEASEEANDEQRPAPAAPAAPRVITSNDQARFRSFATGLDEAQRRDQESLRSHIQRYDNMDEIMSNTTSSSDATFMKGDQEGTYRIKIDKMTDRVAAESSRLYSGIINKWLVKKQRGIEDRRSELEENGFDPNGPEFAATNTEEQEMRTRLHKVKRDLTKYHLRCLLQCFHSAHDRTTLPAGYKNMVRELESLVGKNGGSASMAFPPGRKGKQITSSDRQVWHELQEWLHVIFSKDALIAGRDTFIMDEMYLQCFDVYAEHRFVMIICSDRGKGKSVRAERLAKLLPKGFCANQAASSARAGMNGNMSPNNGTMIIFDEMTKDLTPYEVDERIEFWKQILTNGEYTIERTCRAQKSDGSDSHITCEIVTDHSVAYLICTNLGPCFTPGDREPTSGKFAMINRTFSLFARNETSKASPNSAFERNLQSPHIMERIKDFRLFTCLVSFCKLAMRRCAWLHTDMGLAQKTWDEGDRILHEEYGMPLPEPRRTQRRAETCQTQAIMEAVARVFLYKQTALQFEAGRPLDGTCVAKQFDIGDLWDVLRSASVPSRAVVRDAWVKSLTYSISTSPNGINVMTSICHLANITVSEMFRKMPTRKLDDIVVEHGDQTDDQLVEKYMGADGADTAELHALGDRMTRQRRLRAEWRRKASKTNISGKSPLEAIREVAEGEPEEKKLEYADALFPTYAQTVMHYRVDHTLKWASGKQVDNVENPMAGKIKARRLNPSGGSQKYDPAWIVVKDAAVGEYVKFQSIVTDLRSAIKGITPANLFGYHDAGITDTLMLLETTEAARLCTEMPNGPKQQSRDNAFMDSRKNTPTKESTHIQLRDWSRPGYSDVGAAEGEPVECRLANGGLHRSEIDIHEKLDILVNRGRLPAVQPYTSTRIVKCSPIRRQRDTGVLLNTVAATEHVAMVVEASITCSKVEGLKDHQERFGDDGTVGLVGLSAHSNSGTPDTNPNDRTKTRTLPFSNDIVQINWAIDLASRQYIPSFASEVEKFNKNVDDGNIPGEKIKVEDMPQQPIACMGYPISLADVHGLKKATSNESTILQLLSLPVSTDKKFEEIEVSDNKADGTTLGDDILMNEVGVSLGRKPTSGDIESYKMDRIGENFMWGVEGDLHSYETWMNHMQESMIAKGNALWTGDDAVDCLMDTELMLLCRMHERRSRVKGSAESVYDIDKTWPQTYSALIRKASEPGNEYTGKKKLTVRNKKRTGIEMRATRDPYSKKTKALESMYASAAAAAAASSSDAGPSSAGALEPNTPILGVRDVRDM